MKNLLFSFLTIYYILISSFCYAQEEEKESELQSALSGFSFRSVGPAFMSGRIADIAIDPTNENVWYVAVGSGGTWKTTNAGTTWTPLTDDESFYSTGCITLDPNNSSVVVGYWRKCWWSSCWNRTWDLSECRWWVFVARYGFEKIRTYLKNHCSSK